MKQVILIILFMCSLAKFGQAKKVTQYILIKSTKEMPGEINQAVIDRLDEPLRAIAAYYSALGGTNCSQDTGNAETCDLTSVLGLGNQGSERHKALIKKWFPDDKTASQLLAQDCYQRPSEASSFSDYAYLSMTKRGNIVIINYILMLYEHGKVTYLRGPDKVVIKADRIKVIKRHIQ